MKPVLEYEQPLHVERHRLPRHVIRIMTAAGVILACMPIGEMFLLDVHMGTTIFAMSAIGPLAGAAVLLAASNVSLVTAVFADRLQLTLSLANLRLWTKRVPLATVAEVEIVRTASGKGKRRIEVYRRSLARLAVMFSGSGLRIRLLGGMIYWLGSDDPDALAAAIAFAKEGRFPAGI